MSWMSGKTGRPKEQGGHVRKNITISKETLEVVEEIKKKYGNMNFSQFIENCIQIYPMLEETAKEQTEIMIRVVADLLSKFENSV